MLTFALATRCLLVGAAADGLRLADIHLRDPFILPVPEEDRYYLFGTGWRRDVLGDGGGFMVYTSSDLATWAGPTAAYREPPEVAGGNYWAPEVHRWHGRYYLFGTFYKEGRDQVRHTSILVADRPQGPYAAHSEGGVTPADWFCLDGTLYVDPEGRPWMVFCHEWVQVGDGEICAVRLADDLSRAEGEPTLLFRASDAPWVEEIGQNPRGRVTDGPFLHRTAAGELLMLWSSLGRAGYGLTVARSESGGLEGPWRQAPQPIYATDGGHGMMFRSLAGQWLLTLHQPNGGGRERPRLFAVEEREGSLALAPFEP